MVLLLAKIAKGMSTDEAKTRRANRREERRAAQNERRAARRARNMEKRRLKELGRQAEMSDIEPTESEFDPDADSDLETQQEFQAEYQHELELIQEKTAKEKAQAMKGLEKHW
ncbi:hypothetical protein CJU90_0830 [Yarrowia sp. C11]|nr:hypothetical protein CKK34_2241 [Yarrowia sp. E02]KAG5373155.1 hypothetical protein CJU90_0830 [Yarrowia sp. C11]